MKLEALVDKFYNEIEPQQIASQRGKVALVSKEGLVGIFSNSSDAEIYALSQKLKLGEFCIQEIGRKTESFGAMGIHLDQHS